MKKTILIVGAGPTGLTLAIALANQGYYLRIIDRRNDLSIIPRAINISQNTLATFETLGVDKRLFNAGLKVKELTLYWNFKRLTKIKSRHGNRFRYFYHLEQSCLEEFLVNQLAVLGVTVERCHTLLNLNSTNTNVMVEIKKANGVIEKSHFDYVIGCDGGKSSVRDLLNIKIDEQRFAAKFTLFDVMFNEPLPDKNLHYYLNDAGYAMFVPLPQDRYRIIASHKGNKLAAEDIHENSLADILSNRCPYDLTIKKILWATHAPFYSKIATKAQSRNIFLAGDALHQFSPVGGTNMNAGIADAMAWVTHLRANTLDQYENERLSVAQRILMKTSLATELITRTLKRPSDEKTYLPLMANRQFFKNVLPNLFQ